MSTIASQITGDNGNIKVPHPWPFASEINHCPDVPSQASNANYVESFSMSWRHHMPYLLCSCVHSAPQHSYSCNPWSNPYNYFQSRDSDRSHRYLKGYQVKIISYKNDWSFWYSIQTWDRIQCQHYSDVTMSAMASQITSVSIVCSTVDFSGSDQRKHQRSASLAGEFPAQKASDAEENSIWWRHHEHIWHVFTRIICILSSKIYVIKWV